MSHQDLEVSLNAGCLKQALRWLLAGIRWSTVEFRDDCTYTPRLLAATAMLWAWSDELTLVDRFFAARRIIQFLFPLQQELAGTYQAFIKLLRRWTSPLVALVQTALRQRMRRALPDCWELCGFVMFGVDGSRLELARTRSHEAAYSAARRGSKSRRRRRKIETNKKGIPPRRLSVAQMLRTFRRMLRDYRHPRQRGHRLCDLLRNAVVDSYVRKNKTSRDYPRKKQESPPGAPTITTATKQQIQHAKQLTTPNKKGLTA